MSDVATSKGASVVVVGAGVTGLSTAWWLARSGVDVLVIDKGVVGWEASGRNGGGCTHHQSPLFAEEQRLWPMMDELLGYPTEFQPRRLRIALTDEQLETMKRGVDSARAQGFPAEWLDPAQVREMAPLTGDNVVGGAYFACGGHANPQRTVQAYAWALRDLGGRILQNVAATGFTLAGGKVKAVETDAGDYACEQVVVAAGPQTGVLSAMLGAEVPVAPARAEMIVTEPLPLMPMGGIDGNGLYGRQTLRGNLAYGGGPHEWLPAGGDGIRSAQAVESDRPQYRQAPRGALSQGGPRARHSHLGRHRREHARRTAGHRSPAWRRQRDGGHHVERRLRPFAGERPGDRRDRDRRSMQLRGPFHFPPVAVRQPRAGLARAEGLAAARERDRPCPCGLIP